MFPPGFNPAPVLLDETVDLRPLRVDDYELLAAAASDPKTWEGHPDMNRYKREVFTPYFRFLMTATGTLTIRDKQTRAIIGCSRFYSAPDNPSGISIGFTFLHNKFWGGDMNFAVKRLMLGHAFKSADKVWFHIAPSNIRSQKATAKLGAKFQYQTKMALTNASTDWLCYSLDKSTWSGVIAAKGRKTMQPIPLWIKRMG